MSPAAPAPPDFTAVVKEYQPLLRRVCRLYCSDPDDRQDLFQEVVLQLWRAWPRYQPQAGAKLSTWLYRIALNVAISGLRQRTRRPRSSRLGADEGNAAHHLAQPDEPATYEPEEMAALYRAINRLSDVDKAFVLLYLEERTYEEMADILGITQNNVRVKMHRIQDKLRQLLTRPAAHGTR
ncbi:RNA polymerase sigma factor [Hymenobacter weizhouensis]|uniref:RNA polymerase sigma factor n=1 Tax=Hymenobacter sp. YIM 151500-1 TaxID=2987689 RepID=UPI002226EB66|nr:sigma-70 family RNA polymerase sigma factor [Hymenobacter sp. YIM 151500-1]UYZ65166.1 sigma-70 family RNA polymerase sigma factor [Hymenobacter sp. YIM 151500-1]